METNFKIAKYEKVEDSFVKVGYDEYKVTYLKGTKVHQLRIVVNGYLTRQTINLLEGNSGYKNRILLAIKQFLENGKDSTQPKVVKKISLSYLQNFYSEKVIHNIKTYLDKINKEESRDKLTEVGISSVQNA